MGINVPKSRYLDTNQTNSASQIDQNRAPDMDKMSG